MPKDFATHFYKILPLSFEGEGDKGGEVDKIVIITHQCYTLSYIK